MDNIQNSITSSLPPEDAEELTVQTDVPVAPSLAASPSQPAAMADGGLEPALGSSQLSTDAGPSTDHVWPEPLPWFMLQEGNKLYAAEKTPMQILKETGVRHVRHRETKERTNTAMQELVALQMAIFFFE